MQLIQFLRVLFVSYLGLLAGFFLALIAKEEMPHGKRHIYQAQRLIFFALLIIFLVWMNLNWLWIVIICGMIAVMTGFLHLFRKTITHGIIYALFGISLALLRDTKYFAISAALMFLYGIMTGSFFTQKKDDWKSILRNNLLFFLAGIIAWLIL